MNSLNSWLLLLIFVACAAAIWVSGIKLSNATDVLSERLHLGTALGGVILLAIATNLPELAITASAALSHQLDVAVGNILGGIALQTVVLVILDAAGVRPRKPLTYLAASLTLLLEGALVVALLLVVVMSTQLPPSLIAFRLTPGAVLIAVLWGFGLLLLRRAGKGLPWHEGGDAPDTQEGPQGHSKTTKENQASAKGVSTGRAATVFGIAAAITLVAGVFIERSGEELFGRLGMSGVLFGATVLAAATALPEVSTGLTSTRMGDYQLAISDIFGGNAFLPVLFLLATVLSGQAVLPRAHHSDIYLTALGGLLTVVYMVGLVFRPQRQRLRMGADSLTVLILYALGIAGLAFITG
ncbi:sodium/hydrogen exchanger [Actinoplanes sp. SE50]|uniref:sodium:calcium antiporter n=1 Tax=unclassified Actinoplanes TaxID=2626549 RepID=UPI00023ED06C|nr:MULTISPECIES: sodium/hydrogen exchanger [unclassified Actinoplanes]AEV84374.1 Inner membrane protein yrbG [Actinoplanes sp. SE50/110]ATO82766.1 sodium/hydrogen exchanger [Actinoplanes sp. SE50]SLM00173.1 sodium/hydrogen exchanger [Actinoplanes sp. SE50/110]